MKFGKKIVAAVLAAATALTALSASAFATDPIGTNPITLKDGVQVTEQIPYSDVNFKQYSGFDGSAAFDNGKNYKDFKFTAPANGNLVLTYDISCDATYISCFRASDMADLDTKSHTAKTGSIGNSGAAWWDSNASVFSGVKVFAVEKGDYYIRVRRYFTSRADNAWMTGGTEGNGRLHITAEMEKPDAPGEIQIVEKTDTTAKLQWREPKGCTSYDLRYKTGSGDWTTVKDIMDNNVTIKKLKGATKYTYQMRSHAGEIVGEWSKAASFKTSDPKNVKFDTPKFKTAVAVHIEWNAVKNATGYKFQYSTDQKNWKTITVEEPAADMPVTSGKTYYYKVAAKNSAKTGSFSKVSSIKIG